MGQWKKSGHFGVVRAANTKKTQMIVHVMIVISHVDCGITQLADLRWGEAGARSPLWKSEFFWKKKCYWRRSFIARNPHRQRSLGAYNIVSDKKRLKHNPKPLNPASPAKTSRLPSHSNMNIVENSICVCFITWNHQIFIKAFLLLYKLKKTVKLYGGGGGG